MNIDWTTAFRDKRVLITGHTGFKGSWLTIWLHKLGAQVTGYSLPPPTAPSLFEIAGVRELLERHVEGDVRDGLRLQRVVCETKPNCVFHLAAQPIVATGYENPRETFDVNVLGTVGLLESVRCHGVRPCRVVVVTSDKCYDVPERTVDTSPLGFREDDRLGGDDPYSASKAAAEIVTHAYLKSYFDPLQHCKHQIWLATARAGNVVGGGDWSPMRLAPDIVRAAFAGVALQIRRPDSVRPWQHVLDPLAGYLMLTVGMSECFFRQGTSASHAAHWNFGPPPESCITVRDVVAKFHAALGRGIAEEAKFWGFGETRALNLCSDKARALLGWRPRWSLDETIRRTADWYRRYYDEPGADMRQACLADIAAYEGAEPLP